jgi:hypothetical protein
MKSKYLLLLLAVLVLQEPGFDGARSCGATSNCVILSLLERVANDPTRPRWNGTTFFKRFAK